jgi:hypothetical protein
VGEAVAEVMYRALLAVVAVLERDQVQPQAMVKVLQ